MHHRRTLVLATLMIMTAVLLLPAAANATGPYSGTGSMTYDQAVDYLYAKGYPQTIETYLDNLGTSPLGYRLAGTSSDNRGALYLASKLRAMGFADVRLEKVPVDVWEVKGASVTVGDNVFECSQFAGVPGTTAGGITAPVVYVGSGLAADYAGVDVKGKIVVVDSSMDNFWFNFQGAEAAKHGARAVILTSNASDPDAEWPSSPWYDVAPDALGGNDGEYDMSFAPMIYMSQQDGDWLKAEIAAAPGDDVEATFVSDVAITMADDGGYGYNVLATLKGKGGTGQKVILNAHHDAHLRPGLDDTGAVAQTMAMAKAMKMSGYRPNRDIVFLFDTAEEFGYTDCWYDWSIGAWYFITHEHPSWAGKIAAFWSIELMAREGASLDFNTQPELAAWLDTNAEAGENAGLLSSGYTLETPQDTWQNGWSFQAMGVPSFEVSAGGERYDDMYHSTYENEDEVDWDYLCSITKYLFRLHKSMDRGVLPYDFAARGADLADTLSVDELTAAGVAEASAQRLSDLAVGITAKGTAWQAKSAKLKGAKRVQADKLLLRAAKASLKGYTALDAWDYSAYPHQQTLWDIQYMDAAIEALSADPADAAAATEALTNVGINWNATLFSASVYRYDLTRHDPEYDRVAWGGLGKLPAQFDMTPVWALIDKGDYAAAKAKVQKMRDADVLDLQSRVDALIGTSARVKAKLTKLNSL